MTSRLDLLGHARGGRTSNAARKRLEEHLQTFRGLVLDADGVFFDGRETRGVATVDDHERWRPDAYSEFRAVFKTRDYRDGQGISFLRDMGVRILFASGESEPLGAIVRKLNELPSCKAGIWEPVECMTDLKSGKIAAVEAWCVRHNITSREVTYIGDDRTDCEAMATVRERGGLVVLPSDHQRVVHKYAGLVLTQPGGGGAIRQFAELVCDVRGIDEEGLAIA